MTIPNRNDIRNRSAARLTAFSWFVPRLGVAWRDGREHDGGPGRFLVMAAEKNARGRLSYALKWYMPSERSSRPLYQELAETAPTEDSVAHFASQFGPLGLFRRVAVSGGGTWSGVGETLEDWRNAITMVRHALAVYEGNPRQLFVRGDSIGDLATSWEYRPAEAEPWPAGLPMPHVQVTQDDDVADVAMLYLDQLPGSRFQGDIKSPAAAAASWLRSLINARLASHVTVQVVPRRAGGSQFGELAMAPRSLYGSIWLELARMISGEEPFRRCAHCRTFFRPSRSDARTCTAACRVALNRQKVRQRRPKRRP